VTESVSAHLLLYLLWGGIDVKTDFVMGKKRRLQLQGILDPFTLLKFSQAFREIGPGERLEILYEGNDIPDELFKVVPRDSYRVVSRQALEKNALFLLVLEKVSGTPPEASSRGCPCRA